MIQRALLAAQRLSVSWDQQFLDPIESPGQRMPLVTMLANIAMLRALNRHKLKTHCLQLWSRPFAVHVSICVGKDLVSY
jgi:hypothetical protein